MRRALGLMLLCCFGCGSSSTGGGRDAAAPDDAAPHLDVAPPADAAPPQDAETPDAAAGDAQTGPFRVLAQYTDVGHGLGYAAGFVYAVNYTDDTVHVFDTTRYLQVKTLPVGTGPTRVVTDGTLVFVVNTMRDLGSAYITVIDPASNEVVKAADRRGEAGGQRSGQLPLDRFPWDACALDGRLYVTYPTNAEPDVLRVDIGDAWTEYPLWAAGSGPSFSPAGDSLYVVNGRGIADPNDDAVLLFQPDGTLVTTYETGGGLKAATTAGGKVWIWLQHRPRAQRGARVRAGTTDPPTAVPVGAGPTPSGSG